MKLIRTKLLKFVPIAFAVAVYSTSAIAGDAAAGKAVYDGKGACSACHGATGAGDGVAAAGLDPKPASFATASFRLDSNGDGQMGADADLADVIKNGAAKYAGAATMPGRADLSDAEINDLIAYIRSLQK